MGDVAGIFSVESYHGGAVRAFLQGADLLTTTPFGSVADVVALVSNLRDAADGPESDLDQGIVDDDGMANLVPTDCNALVFERTIPQVLRIVYLGGDGSGGFYPEGINGIFGEVCAGASRCTVTCQSPYQPCW